MAASTPTTKDVIANHLLLTEVLRREIGNRRDDGGMLAMLIINLDCVTRTDGALGYQAGDVLLQQIAERLQAALHGNDILGCISRDEFGCILSVGSEGHAILAAHKILRILHNPFTVAGSRIVVNANLGVAYYPGHGMDAEVLMQHANVAMHEARRSKAGFMVYNTTHEQFSQLQLELQASLNSAIQNNELLLHYQPQISLATQEIGGAEALLRWNRGGAEYVSPSDIITVAENTALITPLTAWVFNTALRQHAVFRRAGLDINVSVNFSARNLIEPELPEFVDQALRIWNVPPEKIVVEITESAMIDDEKRSLETLVRLKNVGVKISIDDFGTGYGSMSYLRKFPVDELKIDVSFVKNMMAVAEDERIVRSIIALGHNFDLRVVAEGVEDKATLQRLTELGCDSAQGCGISEAVPEDEFIKIASRLKDLIR